MNQNPWLNYLWSQKKSYDNRYCWPAIESKYVAKKYCKEFFLFQKQSKIGTI